MGMSWFGRVALAGGWCVALALAGCAGRLADAGAGAGADGGAASLAQDGRQAIGGAQSPVGGELDAHGCLPAAGYAFSVVRNGCIRVFESGVAVVDPGARPGFSSFVVFGTDGERAEVFLPDVSGSRVLVRRGRIWSDGGFSLWLERGEWVLSRPAGAANAENGSGVR